jgi:hypothetical protein
MPPILILSLIIQLALVVHIIKTGRNMTWVFIVLFFPLVGTLAYVIVELLPEWTGSRSGVQLRRKLTRLANPDRDLQQASQNFAVADTAQNAMTLARECLTKGRFAEARDLYERALRGVHADDPALLLGLAQARFGLGDAAGAVGTLDELKRSNPDYSSAEGHLLYARARQQLGDIDAAIHEFEALTAYFAGPEPACRLAELYKSRGRTAEARSLFERVVNESRIAGRHYNALHREWVEMARRELG